jgi:ABC-type branched-subunit amino acid transport system ATPase component
MTGAGSERIVIRDVQKRFGGRTVVDIEDLTLGRHPIEGLIGPNGAGKTTLMNLLTHGLPLDRGTVHFRGDAGEVEISQLTLDEIARLGIVKTNQLIQDFESLTILDSLLLSLARSEQERFHQLNSESKLIEESEEEVRWYLDYFHFENPNGHAGSAGEKKLLDIIRCLLLKPRLLLMDEPTAGLPDDVTRKVMDLLVDKTKDGQMAVLIIEHDLDVIWGICEYVHFMAEGSVVIQGLPEEVRQNRTVAEKYLGADHV